MSEAFLEYLKKELKSEQKKGANPKTLETLEHEIMMLEYQVIMENRLPPAIKDQVAFWIGTDK